MTARWLRGGLLVVAWFPLPSSHASTLWTGPNTHFTQSPAAPSDAILPGKVVLTRGSNQVLYNTAAGESFAGASSPADTEWAFGTLTQYSTLSYTSLGSMRNGDLAGVILNQPMVLHLKNEDIYLSIEFTDWGQHGVGGFAYTRSTAPVAAPPTVNLLTPAAGTTFSIPAGVALTAAVTGDGVTNVEYYANATPLGSATTSPYSVTGLISTLGVYALTAVATAAGLSGTSSVVNITIVAPAPVSLTAPSIRGGAFSFAYGANAGLSYVVQSSSNLVDWVSVVTNVASNSMVPFSESLAPNLSRFYRVGRLANP